MRPLLEKSMETFSPGSEGVCKKFWKSDKMVCDFGGGEQTLEGEPHVGAICGGTVQILRFSDSGLFKLIPT